MEMGGKGAGEFLGEHRDWEGAGEDCLGRDSAQPGLCEVKTSAGGQLVPGSFSESWLTLWTLYSAVLHVFL